MLDRFEHLSVSEGARGVIVRLGRIYIVALKRLMKHGDEVLAHFGSNLATASGYERPQDPGFSAQVEAEARSLDPLRDFRALVAPAAELVCAAASGKRKEFEASSPSAPLLANGTKTLADLVWEYGPRLRPHELTSGGWGFQLDNLLERTVVELFDLFIHHPPLRRCSLCDRVYVPRRNEGNCRWHLWRWPPAVGDAPLELCNEKKRYVIETAERQSHRREYVRLHTRVRRARQRHEEAVRAFGPRSRQARTTRQALREATAEYENLERRRPGLKPNLAADSKDLQPKEEDNG